MTCETCKRFANCKRAALGETCRNYRQETRTFVSPEQYADEVCGRIEYVTKEEHIVTNIPDEGKVYKAITRRFPVVVWRGNTDTVYPYLFPVGGATHPFGNPHSSTAPSKEWFGEVVSEAVDYSESRRDYVRQFVGF